MKYLLIPILALTLASCASAPSSLSSTGVSAFNKTRVIKGLDVLRDTAIDGNKTVPPVFNTETTRKVVTYHRSALLIIDSKGVVGVTSISLDELLKDLPQKEAELLSPYVVLLKTILSEVTK